MYYIVSPSVNPCFYKIDITSRKISTRFSFGFLGQTYEIREKTDNIGLIFIWAIKINN